MKKYLCILLILCGIFIAGCGNKDTTQSSNDNVEKKENPKTPSGGNNKDFIDLTALSSTMVYAEVFSMLSNPDDYIGKTIKMNGPYYSSYYAETDMRYYFVIIEDATACCQQGLEFIWNGEHIYPDDYPKEGAKIEITGIFGQYEELGLTYCYLDVDDITVLK